MGLHGLFPKQLQLMGFSRYWLGPVTVPGHQRADRRLILATLQHFAYPKLEN